MPVHNLTCPECETTLRSKNPIPPGKKVKCPECGTSFNTPEEKPAPEPEIPAAPAKKKPGATPPKKAAKKSRYDDPDDDGLETYAVIQEAPKVEEEEDDDEDEDDEDDDDTEEERERKKKKRLKQPDLSFALDLSVKDPRGPANVMLVRPSNFLIASGAVNVLLAIVTLGYATWPFMFAEHVISDEDAHIAIGSPNPGEGKAYSEFPWTEKRSSDKQAKLDDAIDWAWTWRLWTSGVAVFMILVHSLVVIGGVKMQNMDSYGWSMAASIIAILTSVTVVGFAMGIWCIVVLRNPKVIKAFEHEIEERKKTY
jgi:predicted Zn finger-like uncharacterized protein